MTILTKDELAVGDEVQHRTGGGMMIYVGQGQLGDALCEWRDGQSLKRDSFAYAALKRYEAPAPRGPAMFVV